MSHISRLLHYLSLYYQLMIVVIVNNSKEISEKTPRVNRMFNTIQCSKRFAIVALKHFYTL